MKYMNKRLIEIRKDQHLTQAEFAEKINLTQSAIGNYENGRRIMSDRTIADVCRVFNLNEDWLRYGTGPMYRPKMDRDNLLAAKIGDLINSDDEFIKNLILDFLNLSDNSKEEVKNFIRNASKFL